MMLADENPWLDFHPIPFLQQGTSPQTLCLLQSKPPRTAPNEGSTKVAKKTTKPLRANK